MSRAGGLLLVAGLALASACQVRLEPARYACQPSQPGQCPPGWACQCVGGPCAWRCSPSAAGYCGDGRRDPGEACDGFDFGGATCRDLGYYAGTPVCRADCGVMQATGCTGYCGDGAIAEAEECDGLDQAGATCRDHGYAGGALGCDASCRRTFEACFEPSWVWRRGPRSVLLHGVAGTGPADVFAVGEHGSIFHYDGADWSSMTSGVTSGLFSVWAAAPDDVFAVGEGGVILHHDGASWQSMVYPENPDHPGSPDDFWGVWGTSGYDVFTVGMWGSILRWDGTWWARHYWHRYFGFAAVWGSAPANVLTADAQGLVMRYDGTQWRPFYMGDATQVSGLWGSAANDVYLVGLSSIVHYDGADWTVTPAGDGTNGWGVWGSSPADVFVTTEAGSMLHFDGAVWSPLEAGAGTPLRGIWGSSPDDVFAVGDEGRIGHLVGPRPTADGGACARPRAVYCGMTTRLRGGNGWGSTAFAAWDGAGGRTYEGAEAFYRLHSPITGRVTARLLPWQRDLDLFALGAQPGGGCDAPRTLAASQQPGLAADEVSFAVTAGAVYYLAVDGAAGVESGFELEVRCARE